MIDYNNVSENDIFNDIFLSGLRKNTENKNSEIENFNEYNKKMELLKPIEIFLNKIKNIDDATVRSYKDYNGTNSVYSPKERFNYIIHESTNKLSFKSPCIYIINPAKIEISISENQEKNGLYIITCGVNHPDNFLILAKRYENHKEVMVALSNFFSKNIFLNDDK